MIHLSERMPYCCEEHLRRVKRGIVARIDRKYRAGQREHGGELWEKPALALIENALDEVIDLAVYLETVREQLAKSGNPTASTRPRKSILGHPGAKFGASK